MRVLLATGIYPPEIGGPATFTPTLARFLREQGHQVTVVSYGDEMTRKNDGWPVVVVSRGRTVLGRYLRYVREVWRVAKHSDVVFLQGVISEGVPGMIAARLARVPIVLRVPGDYAWERYQERLPVTETPSFESFLTTRHFGVIGLLVWLERFVARNARTVIVPSQSVATVLERWGVASKCIQVIYSDVPTPPTLVDDRKTLRTRFGYTDEDTVLLAVARAIPCKKLDFIISLLPKLPASYRLVIAGDGPMLPVWRALVAKLQLESRVTFLGRLDQLQVAEQYASSDLLVLPSSHEGFPHVVAEAALAGLSSFVSDRGGNPETRIQFPQHVTVLPYGDDVAWLKALQMPLQKRLVAATPSIEMLPRVTAVLQAVAARPRKKTLIFVQAVDPKDHLFGFFVPWLRAFAVQNDADVCALRVGADLDLPKNIRVFPLRPQGTSRAGVIVNVLKYSWCLRHEYDTVFVRTDAIYLLIAGWLWRLCGKKTVFWYAHYNAHPLWFYLASAWAHEVVTSVKAANPLRRALRIGQHIDTNYFIPGTRFPEISVPTVLVYGRVSTVKRVDWIVTELQPWLEQGSLHVRVVGRALDTMARTALEQALQQRSDWEERDTTQAEARILFQEAAIVINATPGSLDKTILEAAASGCVVLATTPGFLEGLPLDLAWLHFTDASSLHAAIDRVLSSSFAERQEIGQRLRIWVEQYHSLTTHIQKLQALITEPVPVTPFKQKLRRFWWYLSLRKRTGLPVLMFHALDGQGSVGWEVSTFAVLLLRLFSADYTFYRPSDLWRNGQWVMPTGKGVLLTFDDATKDFVHALPWLRMFQMPVVLFAPAGIETLDFSDGQRRDILSREEISALADSGLVTIGGHGLTHRMLTKIEPSESQKELEGSFVFVQTFSTKEPHLFAYPRGKHNELIQMLAKEVGFTGAFTVLPGHWNDSTNPMCIPRLPVYAWMSSKDVLRRLQISP